MSAYRLPRPPIIISFLEQVTRYFESADRPDLSGPDMKALAINFRTQLVYNETVYQATTKEQSYALDFVAASVIGVLRARSLKQTMIHILSYSISLAAIATPIVALSASFIALACTIAGIAILLFSLLIYHCTLQTKISEEAFDKVKNLHTFFTRPLVLN